MTMMKIKKKQDFDDKNSGKGNNDDKEKGNSGKGNSGMEIILVKETTMTLRKKATLEKEIQAIDNSGKGNNDDKEKGKLWKRKFRHR